MFNTTDTIVAISTPAGSARRAIVRLSGSVALELGDRIFKSSSGTLVDAGGFRSLDGRVRIPPGGIELPARAYVFRNPRSYTRGDLAELHVPGAPDAVSVTTFCANPAFDHLSTAGELVQEGVPFPLLPLVACADATLFADDDAGVVFLCQRDLDV